METKQCPFCREQIIESAIKCRYCGEYLNIETNEEPLQQGKRKLLPFDYSLAEGVGYASIFISAMSIELALKTFVLDSIWRDLASVASGIFEIWFWILFSKYLMNFSTDKIRKEITIMNITYAILMLITLFGIPFKGNEDVDNAFLYMSLIPMFIGLFYQLKIGYRLINISNDFVGRLKTVGYSIIFSISLYIIVLVLVTTIEEDETWLTVYLSLAEIIPMIPIVLMLNLLRKAAKYTEESQVNNDE